MLFVSATELQVCAVEAVFQGRSNVLQEDGGCSYDYGMPPACRAQILHSSSTPDGVKGHDIVDPKNSKFGVGRQLI